MNRNFLIALILCPIVGIQCTSKPSAQPPEEHAQVNAPLTIQERATELAQQLIIVDGHVDVPYRLENGRNEAGALTENIAEATATGDFDFPRAKAGGLNAPFMSIYIPAKHQTEGGARALADRLIDMVEEIIASNPDKFAKATSPADIERNTANEKISLPLGIENGAAIEGKLSNLKHFYDRGVRYITLTHSKDNRLCDSSYDDRHSAKGLTKLGRRVVVEMNRLGMMIDVSHVSDDVFGQVLEMSKAPVIASHSSARKFTPDFERNASDALIQQLAKNGGVLMVNFGSTFILQASISHYETRRAAIDAYVAQHELKKDDPKIVEFKKAYDEKLPPLLATVEDVADHIEHVIKLVGIDHVGLGSDFDGVGDSLPAGLKDVSMYPNLFRVLLERGYAVADLQKLASGNVFRVWRAVESFAKSAAVGGQP